MLCVDVQPAIDRVNRELYEVSAQLTRVQPGERMLRDEIDEQKRRLRGDAHLLVGQLVVEENLETFVIMDSSWKIQGLLDSREWSRKQMSVDLVL